MVMWSSTLRALIETYLIGTIGTLRNAENIKWDNAEDTINSLLTIIAVPGVIIFPIWVLWYLRSNFAYAQVA